MAGVDINVSDQYRAVAQMRWRMFLNSLRTRRGSFELGARVVMQLFFALIGLGIGLGLGFAAWQMATHSSLRMLAVLLWPVLIAWQIIPVTIASFQENADLSILLRFPVGFESYAAFYILFGLFDIGTLVGGIALFGVWIGASAAQPQLFFWITLAVALFGAFNILLTRMIFSWLDRWLAQRKTREILGGVFLFLVLGLQLLNPALHQHRHGNEVTREAVIRTIHTADRVQSFLPPGLAANAIANAHAGKPLRAAAQILFVALFAAAAGTLLGIRLHAEYRGENLGEAPSQTAKIARPATQRHLLELRTPVALTRSTGSGPIAAVVEKEFRYLMRSGIMLYGFLAPLFIVLIFSGSSRGAHGFGGQYALPIGVAYSFLGLTRFIYNNLGGEGAGIQLYFLSPTPFRKVMLAKNLVHTSIFIVELALVCVIVAVRAGMPTPQIIAVTCCWLVFAVPAQLGIGNLLSITMAYRMNMTRMSREQGAPGNSLLSLLAQLIIFLIGAAVYLSLARTGHANLGAPALLLLAVGSVLFWLRTLANSGSMAEARREDLITTVYRAT
jgi:ABC-2 type transport system permease protein